MLNCGHEGVSGEQGVEALPPSGLGTEGLKPPRPPPCPPPQPWAESWVHPQRVSCAGRSGEGAAQVILGQVGLVPNCNHLFPQPPPPRPPDVHSPRRKPEARSTWAVRRGPCTGPASLALTCSLPPCTWAGGEDSEPGDPGPRS